MAIGGFFSIFAIVQVAYILTLGVLSIWVLVLAIKALNIYIKNNS